MKLLLSMNLPYLRLNGANKGNRMLAEALSAQGHPFRVIVPSFSPTDQLTRSSFQALLQSRDISFRAEDHKDVFTLNGVEVHSIADPAQLRAELVTELERDEPDFVFISTEDPTQNLLDAALRICPSKVVYIVHTLEFLPFGPHAFFPSQARTRLIAQTAGIVSVSQFVQQYIKEWSGLDSLQLYWPAYGEPPFPHLGSFDNPFVTHINPCAVKGISILLGLADALPQVQFAAVPTWGATQEDRAALAQRVNISLLTPTEHIDELFRHTKVLLVPSLWFEGLGFVTLEAMLRGVPVIAASSGGIPEAKLGTEFVIPVHPIERFTDQLDEHHLPIPIVPTQDLAPWRAALEKLLSDRDFYQQHAADARSRAIEFVSRLSFEPLVAYLHHLASRPKALAATITADPSAISSQDRGNPTLSAANLTPEQRALLLQRLRKKSQTQAATSAEPPVGIQPVPRTHPLPLSFAQQRLWFLDQLEPGSAAYNLPGGFRVRLPVNTAILHQSILEIIRRHEVLRTTFQVIDGEPVQVINPEPACLFSVSDVSHLADRPDGRQALAAHIIEETQSSFDLATGPLVRVKVLKLGAQDWVIVVTMHHIVSDGWSVGVFLREIQTLYAAFSQGKPSPLPPLPIQYADFAVWQREKLSGAVLETQLTFWRQQLGDTTGVLELPTDHSRPVNPSHRGGWEQTTFAPHLVEPLRVLSQSEGCTMFMTLLAAFAVQLSRYTGQQDLLIGTPIANRTRSEIENLIGFFVNTLVIRVNLSGKPGFRDVLRQIRETALGAFAHQDVPFEKLVELLHPDRDLNRTPLFQVMFAFGQEGRASQKSAPPNRTQLIDTLEVENRTSKFDLTLSMAETEAGIIAGFEYKTELFESATIRRFLTHLETLLHGICTNPEAPISSLPLMSEAERDQVLVQPNQTERQFPTDKLLHHLIEIQVRQTPDAIAVVSGDQNVTYHQLNSQADVLAQYLQHLGVGPGALVGVLVERSIEMVTALLGVLKAGGAYVPLDPGYPADRLAFMISDAQASLILTQSHLVERLPHTSAQTICLDQPFSLPARPSNTLPAAQPVPEDLAYVLYTSGSTGQPKGVMIPHRAICNHMHWMHQTFPLSADDRVLQKTPFSFDASVWEFWAPLMAGAHLVMAEPGIHQDAESLSQVIADQQITILQVVPTLLSLLLEEPLFSQCPQLRRVFAGGEALSGNLRDRFFEKLPDVELVNLYGPTECTIDATFFVCQPDNSSRTVPIGKPVSNMTALVLDAEGHPVPIGIPGELYLGGVGVGCGYLRRPELTQERFALRAGGWGLGAEGFQFKAIEKQENQTIIGNRYSEKQANTHCLELEPLSPQPQA
ncbi:MAG TPA: amino acid adenylation domain-containing protein, partial [Acidobacteriota bacterium]|nr:amino acid adenylation domain-containing protein [Acidobacteriota bacterium]